MRFSASVLSVAAALALVGSAFGTVVIPASARVGPVPTTNGVGLNADIWRYESTSIASSRAYIATAVPDGKFMSSSVNYKDSDVWTSLNSWLGSDSSMLTGLPGSTMVKSLTFRFTGFIAVKQAGTYNFTVESDDGMQLLIGGQEVAKFDGARGYSGTTGGATFSQAGLYAVDLLYWANGSGNSGVRLSSNLPGNPSGAAIPKALLYKVPTPGTAAVAALGLVIAGRRRRQN